MSDVFAKNWLDSVKKDPVMNAIFNSTVHMIRYNTRTYEANPLGGFRETVPNVRAVVEEIESDSSPAAKGKTFAEEARAGVLRHGDIAKYTITDPDKYWENKSPASFYSLNRVNTFENPYFQMLLKKNYK